MTSFFSSALITGATSGIGLELAYFLAEKNISLILTGRNREVLKELNLNLSQKVPIKTVNIDLAIPSERYELLSKIRNLTPNLVINNAGFGLYGDAVTYSTPQLLEMVQVNCAALLEITLESAKALLANNKSGVILNVASVAGFYGIPTMAVYSATKAFVIQVSKALDEEMKSHGIRVLTFCPGMVDTAFAERAGSVLIDNNFSLSISKKSTVEAIWWQIEKRKQVYLYDWRYRWLNRFSYLIPDFILAKILRVQLEERIPRNHLITPSK